MSDSTICGQTKCFRPASLLCSRCMSVLYCSKECQLAAFTNHRLTCFELPTLIDVKADRSSNTMKWVEENESCVSSVTKEKAIDVIEQKAEVKSQPMLVQEKPQVAKLVVKETRAEPSSVSQVAPPKPAPLKLPVTPAEPARVFIRDMNVRHLPRGDFNAVVLGAVPEEKLFTIYEATADNTKLLNSIGNSIEEVIAKDKTASYKPQLKEVVLAFYEGTYYRAVCKKIQNDGTFEMCFIDYGNATVLKEGQIKKFDAKKVSKDIFVHNCLFSNFPDELTEQACEILSGDTVPVKGAYKEDGEEIYTATLVGI